LAELEVLKYLASFPYCVRRICYCCRLMISWPEMGAPGPLTRDILGQFGQKLERLRFVKTGNDFLKKIQQ